MEIIQMTNPRCSLGALADGSLELQSRDIETPGAQRRVLATGESSTFTLFDNQTGSDLRLLFTKSNWNFHLVQELRSTPIS